MPQQREYITCIFSLLSVACLQGARKPHKFPSRAHPRWGGDNPLFWGAPRSPFGSGLVLQQPLRSCLADFPILPPVTASQQPARSIHFHSSLCREDMILSEKRKR